MTTGDIDAARRISVQAAVDTAQAWIDRRRAAMVRHLHTCGQSPAQLHVLGVIEATGTTTVSHLAGKLGISPPSASGMVDRMAEADLVIRQRGEEDRRVVTVSLAPAGREALQRALGGRREMLERVFSQLDDEELRATLAVIDRLEEAIRQAQASSTPD